MQVNPNTSGNNPSGGVNPSSPSGQNTNTTSNSKITALEQEKLIRGDIKKLMEDAGSLLTSEYGTLGNFLTETQKKLFELDNGAVSLAKTFGQGRNAVQSLKDSVADSIPLLIALGEKPTKAFEDLAKISEQVGRNLKLDSETIDSFIVIEKVLGITPQNLIDGFQNAGMSIKTIGSEMEKVQTYLSSVGVPVQKVAQTVASNLDKMSLYKFENGVEGLAKMAAKASVMKFDISKAFEMSDKLMDPNAALEFSNSLQRIGVTTSALIDPLRAMQMAFYEPDQLMNEMGNMLTNMVTLNKEGNKFEINPLARMQMMDLAQTTGIPVQNLQKMAMQQAKLVEQGKNFISSVNFPKLTIGDIDENTETLLRNVAELNEKGQWEFSVKGGDKKMSTELSQEDLEYLKQSQQDAGKSLEQIALEQRNFLDGIYQTLKAQVQRPGYAIAANATVGKGLDLTTDMMTTMVTTMGKQEQFKISTLSAQFDTFGDIFSKMVKDINEGKDIFSILKGMGDSAKPLLNFLDGVPAAAGETMTQFASKMRETNQIFDLLVGTGGNLYNMFRSAQDTGGKETSEQKSVVVTPIKDGIFSEDISQVFEPLPQDTLSVSSISPKQIDEEYRNNFKQFKTDINEGLSTKFDFMKNISKPQTTGFENVSLTEFVSNLSDILKSPTVVEIKQTQQETTRENIEPLPKLVSPQITTELPKTITPEIKPGQFEINSELNLEKAEEGITQFLKDFKQKEITFNVRIDGESLNELKKSLNKIGEIENNLNFKTNLIDTRTEIEKIKNEKHDTTLTVSTIIKNKELLDEEISKIDKNKDKQITITEKFLKTDEYTKPTKFSVVPTFNEGDEESKILNFKEKVSQQTTLPFISSFDPTKTETEFSDFMVKIKEESQTLKIKPLVSSEDLYKKTDEIKTKISSDRLINLEVNDINFKVTPELNRNIFDPEFDMFTEQTTKTKQIDFKPRLINQNLVGNEISEFTNKFTEEKEFKIKGVGDFDSIETKMRPISEYVNNGLTFNLSTKINEENEKGKFDSFLSKISDNKINITPEIYTDKVFTNLTNIKEQIESENIQMKGINTDLIKPQTTETLLPKTREEFIREQKTIVNNNTIVEPSNSITSDRLVEILMKNKEQTTVYAGPQPITNNLQMRPEIIGPQFDFEKMIKEPSITKTENTQKVDGKITIALEVNGNSVKEYDLANALRYGGYGSQIGKIIEQSFNDGLVQNKMQQLAS